MKELFAVFALILLLTACNGEYDPENYLFEDQKDETLLQIVTYVYTKPSHATWKTRFDSTYREYYAGIVKEFSLQNFYISENGNRYFYVIRPARSATGDQRGVGGIFRVDANGNISSFREVFNTPVAPASVLKERGEELFRWMIKHGNVEAYQKNPDYIEWPNKFSYYDTLRYEWVAK